ncbi:MAG: hypothetical protein PVJ27_03805, partial [Candidatus Brocadiaceae bacterium]
PEDETPVSGTALDRMEELLDSLRDALTRELQAEEAGGDEEDDEGSLPGILKELSDVQRDRLADAVELNGHRRFVRRRYMPAEEFRDLFRCRQEEEESSFALVKLVPYLRRELQKRGFSYLADEIREFFREESDVAEVPSCLRAIVRHLDGEFSTGLIPMERLVGDQDPDEWLEQTRTELLFRSHSAMHKAIAEASSLKYDCVHKALSGRSKAKRIQAEIKYCLERWLRETREGKDPKIDDKYRGVPVEMTCGLLPALEQRYSTKEEFYRLISRTTGIKAGSVRRYFQSNGQLKYAPLSVYRCACELAGEDEEGPESYLADSRTRQVAARLARRTRAALRRWREEGDDPELELEFRQCRHQLIVAIKEGWSKVPSAA